MTTATTNNLWYTNWCTDDDLMSSGLNCLFAGSATHFPPPFKGFLVQLMNIIAHLQGSLKYQCPKAQVCLYRKTEECSGQRRASKKVPRWQESRNLQLWKKRGWIYLEMTCTQAFNKAQLHLYKTWRLVHAYVPSGSQSDLYSKTMSNTHTYIQRKRSYEQEIIV